MSEDEFPAAERRPKLEITFDDEPAAPAPPIESAAGTPQPVEVAPEAVTEALPAASAASRFCSGCSTPLAPGAAFCEGCGSPTSGAATEPPTQAYTKARKQPLLPVPPAAPALEAAAPHADGPSGVSLAGRITSLLAMRRRPISMIAGAIVAGVVLLVVLQSIFGTTRGADSSRAAVQQLIAATVNEDPAGVATILAPDETQGLGDLVNDTVGRARSANLLGQGRGTIAGVDITATGIQLQDQAVSNSLHRVSVVGGSVTVTTKARDANEIGREAGLSDGTHPVDTTQLRVMTVKRDGRWFVSPAHTLAEVIVTENDSQIGDFSQDPDAIGSGAKTPEDAVKQVGTAALSGDITSLQQALARPERGLMQSYSAAITEAYDDSELQSEIANAGQVSGGDFKVTDLGGGYKKVEINTFTGTFRGEAVSFDGQCVRLSGESYCASELNSALGFYDGGLPRALPKVPVFTGRPFVVVHKDKKGWAASLPATAIEYLRVFLRQHPKDTQIAELIGYLPWVPSKATVTVGANAKGKTDELWGNVRVNRGTAHGVALLVERKDHIFGVDGNGDSDEYYLGGKRYPQYYVELPGDDGAAGSFVASTMALNGTLDVKTFAVPAIKQRPPDGNAIEVSIPLTTKSPVVVLTGPTDVNFDIDESSAAYLNCTGFCSFPVVVAAKSPSAAGPVKIKLSDLGATIDGRQSADTFITGDSPTSYNLVVPSGKVATIDATPSGSELDIVLEAGGERTDDTLSGNSESMSVSGPFDGTLEVSSYSSDESDSVTIAVTTR